MNEQASTFVPQEAPKISRRNKVPSPRLEYTALDRQRTLVSLATSLETLPRWRRDLVSSIGNPDFLRLLGGGSWDDSIKAVAIEEFLDWMNEAGTAETLLAELPERLDFWQANIPPEVFNPDAPSGVRLLLSGSLVFLQELLRTVGKDRFGVIFRDADAAAHFRKFERATGWFGYVTAEEFDAFSARERVPVECDPGEEKRRDEIGDIIVSTGLEPMMRVVSSSLRAVSVEAGWGSTGNFDLKTGEITVGADGASGMDLPDTLFHEVGHGVQALLSRVEDGHRKFVSYAIAAAFEPQTQSTYAESFRVRDPSDADSFVSESFAEDFRLFFFAPERLPPMKRAAIDRIVAERFPEIEPEDVRRRVRSVLGNFYGRSVNDVLRPTNCENAKRQARYAERVKAENERDEEEEAAA